MVVAMPDATASAAVTFPTQALVFKLLPERVIVPAMLAKAGAVVVDEGDPDPDDDESDDEDDPDGDPVVDPDDDQGDDHDRYCS